MKYLAIFKDSWREALDSKVLYVMLGLSALLILLTFSTSFEPGKPDSMLVLAAVLVYGDLAQVSPEALEQKQAPPRPSGALAVYHVLGARPLGDAPARPSSPWTVTLRADYLVPAKAEEVRAAPDDALAFLRERYGSAGGVKFFDVTAARPAAADNEFLPAAPGPTDVFFELDIRPNSYTARVWPHRVSLFFGAWQLRELELPLALQLLGLLNVAVNAVGAWVAILVSVVITALFIPNMLHKGTIDLLLVKPIRREVLLAYKYLGGLLFIALNTAFVVAGVWLALGVRSGVWVNHFLLSIFVITFFFAVLYSVSTLFAVLTRSAIVAILMTCLTWFLLWFVGVQYVAVTGPQPAPAADAPAEPDQAATPAEPPSPGYVAFIKGAHFVLPRTHDLDVLMHRLLFADLLTGNQISGAQLLPAPISWAESITVSVLFIVVMLGLACAVFAVKSF